MYTSFDLIHIWIMPVMTQVFHGFIFFDQIGIYETRTVVWIIGCSASMAFASIIHKLSFCLYNRLALGLMFRSFGHCWTCVICQTCPTATFDMSDMSNSNLRHVRHVQQQPSTCQTCPTATFDMSDMFTDQCWAICTGLPPETGHMCCNIRHILQIDHIIDVRHPITITISKPSSKLSERTFRCLDMSSALMALTLA